jgi:MFS family permease
MSADGDPLLDEMAVAGASPKQQRGGAWSSNRQFMKLAVGVSLFAFLVMFRPSEGVLVDFVTLQQWASSSALTNDVFPWFSYAYAVASFLCALAAASSGFKLLVIVGCFGNVAATVIWVFLGFNGILLLFTQLLVGIFFGTLAMFQALLLATTTRDRHAAITSFVRGALLLGSVSGALLGELVTAELADRLQAYSVLFYLTIATSLAAFIGSFWLPNEPRTTAKGSSVWLDLRRSVALLWRALRDAALCKLVLWSSFWGAVHMLVLVHYQALFEHYTGAPNNNLVLGIAYGGATVFALLQSFAPVQRALSFSTDVTLALSGAVAAACLYGLYAAKSDANALTIYACFVVYHCCFEFVQPFLIVQMARRLRRSQFGVVFGAQQALAISLQVLMQITLQLAPWFRDLVENKFLLFVGVCGALATFSVLSRLVSCAVSLKKKAPNR